MYLWELETIAELSRGFLKLNFNDYKVTYGIRQPHDVWVYSSKAMGDYVRKLRQNLRKKILDFSRNLTNKRTNATIGLLRFSQRKC
jgi:hypothetical protein